jgi:hypothetical protein
MVICTRAMDIAIMIAFFNVGIGLVNFMVAYSVTNGNGELSAFYNPNTGGMLGQVSSLDSTGLQSSAYTQANTLQAAGNSNNLGVLGWFGQMWQGFFYAITIFLQLLGGMVNGVQIFLENLGFNGALAPIAWLIQGAVWIIYAIGIVQFIGGRGFREAQ